MNKTKFLETIKIFDGEVYNLSYHQKRYQKVLSSFGVDTFVELSTLLNPPAVGLYRCRLIYTPQNTFEVTYHPYSKRNIKTLKIIEVDTLEYSQKYENRDTLNYYFEQREDADDILFVKNALVTDTTIANIAFYQDGVWFTPASPLLEGTTRERYLESGVLIPKDIKVEELHNYSQIALLNAMIDFDIIADIRFK